MKAFKKFIAIFVCIVLFCLPIFSLVYISEHLHHNCTGSHCTICAQLEVAQQSLSAVKSGLILLGCVSITILSTRHFYMIRTIISLCYRTLISLNVELLE